MRVKNPKACAGSMPRLLPIGELKNRPCEVDGLAGCLFHRWVEEDRVLLHVSRFAARDKRDVLIRRYQDCGIVEPGLSVDIVRETFALVELPSGHVCKVKPELVTFIDKEGRRV